MKIDEYTISIWTSILHDRQIYLNKLYNKEFEQVLQANTFNEMKLWKNYYCRYMSDYQSTLVC